jgi:hypothetical protein
MMGDADYDELTVEYTLTAAFWFWLFIALIVLLMLNMLMAIVMDVYTSVKSAASDTMPVWEQIVDLTMDKYNQIRGKTVSAQEILRCIKEMTETDIDKDILKQRVGPGLSDEQAEAIMEDAKVHMHARLNDAVTMTEAMRMIGFLKLSVGSIDAQLVTLLRLEKEEVKMMHEGGHGAVEVSDKPEDPSANLAKTDEKIDMIAARLQRIEGFMQDAVDFNASRGKDLRCRMQLVEELLRGQRDALATIGRDMWEEPPPRPKYQERVPDVTV